MSGKKMYMSPAEPPALVAASGFAMAQQVKKNLEKRHLDTPECRKNAAMAPHAHERHSSSPLEYLDEPDMFPSMTVPLETSGEDHSTASMDIDQVSVTALSNIINKISPTLIE